MSNYSSIQAVILTTCALLAMASFIPTARGIRPRQVRDILKKADSTFFTPGTHTRHAGKKIQSESDWETAFMSVPSPARAYEHLAYYTSIPHLAGTPGDAATAKWTAEQFTSYGIENVTIAQSSTLLSYPVSRSIQLVDSSGGVVATAGLKEDVVPSDPTSGDPRFVETYNGYSANCSLTNTEYVYVNYGSVEDYATLATLNVSVKGKIAIVRYGNLFRGTKVMIAQEHGAVGVIIYSDPADDGYAKGKTYPEGPWRSPTSVQRGSVSFLSICPGNPNRPCGEKSILPTICVQPMSYADATPILSTLQGPEAPSSWQGALKFTYHVGPGPNLLNMNMAMDDPVVPMLDVLATIPGTNSDEYIVIGNHRDAWTPGAVDPNSGTAAMLEVARGLSSIYQQGWRPQRTIIIASWDGEEFGLIGSTNYGESNAAALTAGAVTYINMDTAVSGPNFSSSATPSLTWFIRDAASQVTDPNSGKPLSQVWNGDVGRLGSGSDFSVFDQHLGIASVTVSFDGDYGVYHSIYDSMHWMANFGDTNFTYHATAAQLWGLMALRLADASVLPFNYTRYSEELVVDLTVLSKLVNNTTGVPSNFTTTPISTAITYFTQSATNITTFQEKCTQSPSLCSAAQIKQLNTVLYQTERKFLGSGLPQRPWYKNVIVAPGLYKGYGADTYPGLTQAVRDGDWASAATQMQAIVTIIQQAGEYLLTGSS